MNKKNIIQETLNFDISFLKEGVFFLNFNLNRCVIISTSVEDNLITKRPIYVYAVLVGDNFELKAESEFGMKSAFKYGNFKLL